MRPMATYTERLATVQAAIDDILTTGVSVRLNNRSLTKANLTELMALEQRYSSLAAMENAAANGGGRARVTYVTPL